MRTSEQDLEIGRILSEHGVAEAKLTEGLEDGAIVVHVTNHKSILIDRWGHRHQYVEARNAY